MVPRIMQKQKRKTAFQVLVVVMSAVLLILVVIAVQLGAILDTGRHTNRLLIRMAEYDSRIHSDQDLQE